MSVLISACLPFPSVRGDQESLLPISQTAYYSSSLLALGPSSLLSFPLSVPQSLPSLSLALEQLTEVVFYRGAGTGGLGLAIEGPSEAKMSCKDNKDGSCTVEYIPFTPGDYDVNITFGGQPIPGGQTGRVGWALGRG